MNRECKYEILSLPGIKSFPLLYKCKECGRMKSAQRFYIHKKRRYLTCKICQTKITKQRNIEKKKQMGVEAYNKEKREISRKSRAGAGREGVIKRGKANARSQGRCYVSIEERSRRAALLKEPCKPNFAKQQLMFRRWEYTQPDEYFIYMVEYFGQKKIALSAIGSNDRARTYRLRYRLDNEFNLQERIRRQFNKIMKRDGIADVIRQAINNNSGSNTVEALLGYTIKELKEHLESLFTDEMSWADFSKGNIHIDHVIPQRLFNMLDDDEYRRCWALSNLQPLWAYDNWSKGGKYEPLPKKERNYGEIAVPSGA